MIPLNPFPQFILQDQPQVQGGGSLVTNFFYFLRSLFLRTGGASGIPATVGQNLTASGASQATALLLSDDYNEVLNGNGGVMLTALQPAQSQEVFNGLGGNLNVYPSVIGEIDVLGVNAPYVLATGKTQRFTCYEILTSGGSLFRSLQLG